MDYSKKVKELENEIKQLTIELDKNDEIIYELVECGNSIDIEPMQNLTESERKIEFEKIKTREKIYKSANSRRLEKFRIHSQIIRKFSPFTGDYLDKEILNVESKLRDFYKEGDSLEENYNNRENWNKICSEMQLIKKEVIVKMIFINNLIQSHRSCIKGTLNRIKN